jgi:Cys-tRNA(Pro) deacylase
MSMNSPQPVLTSTNLSQFIRNHEIKAEIIFLDVKTPTVAAAAAALGVQPEQIIKSLLFLADKRPILVIANGLTRVDRKLLADHLQVSRRRVKIASADQVLAITGYVAGSVPPFGHRESLPTIVETAVLSQTQIYGGGGDMNALLRLSVSELQRVVGNEVATLAE